MKSKFKVLICLMALTVSMIAACSKKEQQTTTNPPKATEAAKVTVAPTPVPDSQTGYEATFTEASIWEKLVADGKLPKVEERLPVKDDIMVEYMESVGTYGDAFSFTFAGKSSQWWYGKITEEPLFRFKSDGSVEPNVAKAYDINNDATEFTIFLREGMKWSDGVPFTVDDVLFFYNEMCVKETFGKSLWDCFKIKDADGNDTIAEFVRVDDYTFKVIFKAPKPTFLQDLAINGKWCFAPAHWYKDLLPDLAGQEAAEKKAIEMGYADAVSMNKDTGYYYWNVPGRPTLRPWIVTADGPNNYCDGEYFIMERNPYYWKVDVDGKQLPYMDELRFTKVSDPQQSLLKVLDGTTDVAEMDYTNYDVLIENSEKGNYDLLEWSGTSWAASVSQLHLNQTVKDDNKRALFQNKTFREALSVAVDREEFAAIVSDGFSKGTQAGPVEGGLGSNEVWKTKWTEYNPTRAKELLESCGLVMGSDGYYNFADGSDFVLNLQTFTDSGADNSSELMMKYYKEVGIECTYKPVDRALLDNMTTSNDHEAIIAPVVAASTFSIILRPDTIVPVRNYASWYGTVGNWVASGGTEGMEPTGDLLKLTELYQDMRIATTMEEKEKIALEMLKLHEENLWIIGYMEDLPVLIAKDSDIHNFAEYSIYCDEFRGLGIAKLHTCYKSY